MGTLNVRQSTCYQKNRIQIIAGDSQYRGMKSESWMFSNQ